MKWFKKILKKSRASLLIILVAILALESTSLVQNHYSQKGMKGEAMARAEGQLDAIHNKIMDVVNQVEIAVKNNEWIAQWALTNPDSIPAIPKLIINNNPIIVGSTLAVIPNYYKNRSLYSPYCLRQDGNVILKSLATDEYNYPEKEWFVKPIELQEGYWSEPYIDIGGGEILMSTYSIPIHDSHGNIAAVLTADLSLDWLSELVEKVEIYPNSFGMIISREGRLMVAPAESLIMKKTIDELASEMDKDSNSFKKLNKALLSRQTGTLSVKQDGVKSNVYFAPVERTGWSMSIVIPEKEIFAGLRKVNLMVRLLQIAGLVLLFLIMRFAAKNLKKLQTLNERKERMESELKIGRSIQMSMIPKIFPPFPERKDIDMYASIVPAKEVSGDLYDFYIKDEKLFFCVGDVSGKGVPASLVMAVARSLFRSIPLHEKNPTPLQIVTEMNISMSDMNESNMFVTFFCGMLDLNTGLLKYCNAGHNAPMILNGRIDFLPVKPNVPIGIVNDFIFEEQEIQFNPDDAIFVFTDGVVEAENIAHEQFGEDRLKKIMCERRSSYQHFIAIQSAVQDFVGQAPQSDDITVLFIHYLNKEKELSDTFEKSITLKNDIGEIVKMREFMEEIANRKSLDSSLAASLNLAVEEAVTNVISYAYPKGTQGDIQLTAEVGNYSIKYILSDSGQIFDPTAVSSVDTSLDASERKIGGLGIHLFKKIMDTVKYERKDGKNILSMIKTI